MGDGVHGRSRAAQGRDAGNPSDERRIADPVAVRPGTRALRCVHHEVAAPAPKQVDHGGAFSRLGDLPDVVDNEPGGGEDAGGTASRRQREAEVGQTGRDRDESLLVTVADRQERRAAGRKRPT